MEKDGTRIECHCGKLVARERAGKIWLYCRGCKREVCLDDLIHRKSPESKRPETAN